MIHFGSVYSGGDGSKESEEVRGGVSNSLSHSKFLIFSEIQSK